MKNEEIVARLNDLHLQIFPLEDLAAHVQANKTQSVKDGDQDQAKQLWIYQTIIEIHQLYRNAFTLLKEKSYYKGWCQLERVEIAFHNLKRHFSFDKKKYFLWTIEKAVRNLQIIFPYKMFGSMEIVKKKVTCTVCNQQISIRNPCAHIVGEIYNGEMCGRYVIEADILAISLVENPGNKYSVMFLKDEKTGEQTDNYNYDILDYLFNELNITSPYEFWDLEVSQREIQLEDYGKIGRNDPCSCNSGTKFKNCCLRKVGDKYPHYEFILVNPSDKNLFINSLYKTIH